MKQISLWRLAFIVGLAAVARAAESPVAIVLRADAARLEAMRTGDGAAVARVFSDEVVFVHSDGRSESKADYVKNMTAGDTAYADLKTADVTARQIAADVIVLAGAQEMKKKLGPTWSEIKIRFLSVWRNEGGTWRMVAWQSMKPAGNSVVPPAK
ncbi:MAG: nuclear transport factor 2 family protein [Opitutus sp.]|nr:nuclear transport factor 2 family protein [Opitutus sp.]